jgi:hypothetical protein
VRESYFAFPRDVGERQYRDRGCASAVAYGSQSVRASVLISRGESLELKAVERRANSLLF